MVERILFAPGGSTEDKQDDILTALAALLTELNGKLEPDQAVALNAATLAALETINAVVTGSVALDAPTLAALESITATVSNFPADYPDAAVLAKLEAIRVLLDGAIDVAVSNFPANYPLPAAQVTTLTPQTDALTDAEIRATPLPVSGTVTVNEPVTVDGTVNIGTIPEVEVKNDSGNPLNVGDLNKLVPVRHDEVVLAYTGDNLTSVVFKLAAATVATLTLAYTGDRLDSVVRT